MTNILFISANRIGDAILSTGLLRHVTETYPGANITVACGPLCVDMFAAVPGLRRILPLEKKSFNRHWLGLWRACATTRWDIIIDLRNSLVSRLLWRRRLYAHGETIPDAHKVAQNAAIMQLVPPPDPKIWVTDAMQAEARQLLGAAPTIALGPAANWYPKQWPAAHFAALVQRLLAVPALAEHRILVLAAAHEREQIMPVVDAIPPSRRLVLVGSSLALAGACLQRAELYVGNDSGLMHLAAAVGTPTLGLFGPGYEKTYGPWGRHTAVVRTPESTEELLGKLSHPGAKEPNLMESLAVETVALAALQLLKNRKG